jgi:hypothetical protein
VLLGGVVRQFPTTNCVSTEAEDIYGIHYIATAADDAKDAGDLVY